MNFELLPIHVINLFTDSYCFSGRIHFKLKDKLRGNTCKLTCHNYTGPCFVPFCRCVWFCMLASHRYLVVVLHTSLTRILNQWTSKSWPYTYCMRVCDTTPGFHIAMCYAVVLVCFHMYIDTIKLLYHLYGLDHYVYSLWHVIEFFN